MDSLLRFTSAIYSKKHFLFLSFLLPSAQFFLLSSACISCMSSFTTFDKVFPGGISQKFRFPGIFSGKRKVFGISRTFQVSSYSGHPVLWLIP